LEAGLRGKTTDAGLREIPDATLAQRAWTQAGVWARRGQNRLNTFEVPAVQWAWMNRILIYGSRTKNENPIPMKKTNIVLMGAALLPFVSGCISHPMKLAAVGPDPDSRAASGPVGFLQVFSATETDAAELVTTDYHGYFHPHTAYDIKDESGKTVEFVPNHRAIMDEAPDQVKLPAGHYNIVAQSVSCGLVNVPVLIQAGKTTLVHLDSGAWQPSHSSSDQLVYLPDGDSVGWSSSTAKSSN
jgi:hypothetical protein